MGRLGPEAYQAWLPFVASSVNYAVAAIGILVGHNWPSSTSWGWPSSFVAYSVERSVAFFLRVLSVGFLVLGK